jgi:hypothetical protein
MLPYFVIFSISACLAVFSSPKLTNGKASRVVFILYTVMIALMIGFRWRVGADWGWDTRRMILLRDADLVDYTSAADSGYALLMWLGTKSGFNIWFVHLLAGGMFAYGLSRFCLNQIHPWLCMTVAIPYLVIVVAMGYDRQAVAIGFVMLAMIAMQNRSVRGFVGSMALAATMHITALSLMPVFLLGSRINKYWAVIAGGPVFALGYFYSLGDKVDATIAGYIDTGYSSSGAAIRVVMNALPAILFLVFRSRFKLDDDDRRFMTFLALLAIAFVGFLYVSPSSTAVDRMAIYIIPIQLYVLGRLPFAFARTWADYKLLTAGVVVYSAAVMVVWLDFADNAYRWLPYSLIDANSLVGLSY